MPGKANCCCPARMQHSVLCPRFHGEDGSEDLLVRFGAALVDRRTSPSVLTWWQPEKASPPSGLSAPPTVRPPALLALMSGSRPLSGDANESLPAVAYALGPSLLLQRSPASHPELVVPQALRCGGCSYPRERNRSPICKEIYRVFVGAKCNRLKYLDICRRSREPLRVLPTSKSV